MTSYRDRRNAKIPKIVHLETVNDIPEKYFFSIRDVFRRHILFRCKNIL